MRNIHTISLLIGLISLILCSCGQKPLEPGKPVYVTIETTMGDVTVRLYDDTPLHRDNFIKLCQTDFYEGVLFHRVIKEFVAQGGDMSQEPFTVMMVEVIPSRPRSCHITSTNEAP